MEISCTNCSNEISHNYCSQCGQKKFRRIDNTYIREEIQYTLLHINKGFLYSVKCLLKNPGKTAYGYIHGIRVNHYKPILLAVVLSVAYGFISNSLMHVDEKLNEYTKDQTIQSPLLDDFYDILTHHQNLVTLFMIPIFAILTRFVFRREKENYYEHIIINAYLQATYSIFFLLIFLPAGFFIFQFNLSLLNLSLIGMLIYPTVMIWFFKTYYSHLSIGRVIGKVLLLLFLSLFGYVALATLIITIDPNAIIQQ